MNYVQSLDKKEMEDLIKQDRKNNLRMKNKLKKIHAMCFIYCILTDNYAIDTICG